jgi:hypothetical protein
MYTYHFVKITHIRSNFGFLFQNRTKPTPRELVLINFFILTEKLCELKCVVVNYAILVITTTNYVNNLLAQQKHFDTLNRKVMHTHKHVQPDITGEHSETILRIWRR